jgi:hypothetical protein
MACPFFKPLRQLDAAGWRPAPRMPLGAIWGGECCANAAAPFEPPEAGQRDLCNLGYARGRCRHFPAEAAADAVRFSPEERGGAVRLLYILEREHVPVEFGAAEALPEPLATQAAAFMHACAKMKTTA